MKRYLAKNIEYVITSTITYSSHLQQLQQNQLIAQVAAPTPTVVEPKIVSVPAHGVTPVGPPMNLTPTLMVPTGHPMQVPPGTAGPPHGSMVTVTGAQPIPISIPTQPVQMQVRYYSFMVNLLYMGNVSRYSELLVIFNVLIICNPYPGGNHSSKSATGPSNSHSTSWWYNWSIQGSYGITSRDP